MSRSIQKLQCSICSGYIKPLHNKNGEVVWTHGNNAKPVNDGRCCDDCNKYITLIRQQPLYSIKPIKVLHLMLTPEESEKKFQRRENELQNN